MNDMTRQLAEALRTTLVRAEEEYQSLLELGRDDEDTAEEAVSCGEELDHARAVLSNYDSQSTTDSSMMESAVDRIRDMLKDDDGQAFKEAQKFLDKYENKVSE